jgi:hypothetical protein
MSNELERIWKEAAMDYYYICLHADHENTSAIADDLHDKI